MSVKAQVKELLDTKQFEKVAELSQHQKSVVRYLFSFLYSTDDLLHWRAAETLGLVAVSQARQGAEAERNIPRRLVWSLAEESGSTAWPAPEALGAVVSAKPSLFPDFARIVMSFIDDPVLCRGVLWSARKISEKRPDLIYDFIPKVMSVLKDPNPTLRGHAAWALGAMKAVEARSQLKDLQADESAIHIYDNRELKEKTVGELAINSLTEINQGSLGHRAGPL